MNDSLDHESPVEQPPVEADNIESASDYSQPTEQISNSLTPLIIGVALVVAFAIGLALGFFGRPKIIADVPVQVVVTAVPAENGRAAAQTTNPATDTSSSEGGTAGTSADNAASSTAKTSPGNSSEAPVSEAESAEGTEAQPTPTIMEFLLADARHFQGDDAAPVTIIEFSDFK